MRLRVFWGDWRGQERCVWVVSKQALGMIRKEVKGSGLVTISYSWCKSDGNLNFNHIFNNSWLAMS